MDKPEIFYGYIVLVASIVILAVVSGLLSSFGIFLTPMLAEFGWGSAIVSGAMSVAILLSGLLGFLAGRLTDRFGPKRVVIFCNLFFGLGVLLMSQTNTVGQLYLFYGIFVAMGLTGSFAPLEATIVRWFAKKRGLILSIFLMGMTGGDAIMPLIADWLIRLNGWRTAYLILGAVSLPVILLAAFFLKQPGERGQLPYGVTDASERPLEGLSLRAALHTVQFWLLCIYFFCIAFTMMITIAHIVPYAIDMGISSAASARILSTIGIVATAILIPEGLVIEKIGISKTALIFTALLTLSFLWLAFVGDSVWSLLVFAIIFGLVWSSLDMLLALLSSNLFGLLALGAIIGFVNAVLHIGAALGPFISGHIFDSTGSYYLSFLICIPVSFTAFIMVLFLRLVKPVSIGRAG